MTEHWRRFQRLPRWVRRTTWTALAIVVLVAVAAGGGSGSGTDQRAADASPLDPPAPARTTSDTSATTSVVAARPIAIRTFRVRPVAAGLKVLLGWARAQHGVRWTLSISATGSGPALSTRVTGTGRPEALRFSQLVPLGPAWARRSVTTRLTVSDSGGEAAGTRVVQMPGRPTPRPAPVVTPAPEPSPQPKATPPKRTAAPSPQCDPNYQGACLDPTASDYDCAGGSGNGPMYTGRVTVVGDDHWGLDRNGDGIGCEDS